VNIGALDFVLLGGGRLEDEDALYEQEEASGVGEWMYIKEDDFVFEDCSPYLPGLL